VQAVAQRSLEEIYAEIVERLRTRHAEIEQAIYLRIQDAIPDSVGGRDSEYQTGMRAAIAAAVDYGLEGITHGPEWSGPIPLAAATQARRAARAGVSLGTVLRRYVAGHRRLGEFVAEEVDRAGLASHGPALQHLRRTQEALLEQVTAAIEHEYDEERERAARSPEQRRTDILHRLLAGEPVGPAALAELNYELDDAWHLGVIATGANVKKTLERLQAGLGCRLLSLPSGEDTVWAWLGGRRKLSPADLERALSKGVAVSLALGEPRRGIDGWRQTHQEAQAALLVARRRPHGVTHCADVPLEAALLLNETLARLLTETYLAPLDGMRNGGQTARETLRAYFQYGRNVSSAAFALGVARRTVENRLHQIEQRLERPLQACLTALDVALRLEALGARSDDS
jgi:hypothetical protein